MNRLLNYLLDNPLVTALIMAIIVLGGVMTAPFDWESDIIPRDPVAVDAIPDIGENQQIVYTPWPGRSPQDIEDQISYPLTTSLLGIPGVKSIRSSSIFGVSSIYIIFEEGVEFYWSRSRILEKLNSLPAGLLPAEVQPTLGPDATALGQIYWYTLEGRDPQGNPTGGWDLHEIRSVQDFYVKYALNAVSGVSEVASIGGYVQEYQIDVDPDALKVYGIPLHQVMMAVKNNNRDAGAKTIEINQAEYLVRGLGYIKDLQDLEQAVVAVNDNIPIRILDIAKVKLGPSTRRGVLDKDGAEVVGGVVVARYGGNPMQIIGSVKDKIKEIAPGLPKKTLDNGVESQLTIVPFYDRSVLIQETLGTLNEALDLEVLITILVVLVMVMNLRAGILISALLPIAILMVFIAMRLFGVDANIVALSGIAIAIGTMVDLGIVLSENVLVHLDRRQSGESLASVIYNASAEVSSAILTAVMTTIVSFIPVFTLQAAEGKLFRPLAFTKTFALLAALIVALFILPTVARWIFGTGIKKPKGKILSRILMAALAIALLFFGHAWAGWSLLLFVASLFLQERLPSSMTWRQHLPLIVALVSVVFLLATYWMPLGAGRSSLANIVLVVLLLGIILLFFKLLENYYERILRWCLLNKKRFLLIPSFVMLFALMIWQGFGTTFSWFSSAANAVGWEVDKSKPWSLMAHAFPGIGQEFMPALDEGSFLLMPTSMPHAGIEENKKVVQQLDMLLANIPEVELAVGKLGRTESALDPAPISMYENIINYRPEYEVDAAGHRKRFATDEEGRYLLSDGRYLMATEVIEQGIPRSSLTVDEDGDYFRNWRDEIRSPDDIWSEIVRVTSLPGVTSAPKLQPIETRLVMLQTGMRAPMGMKVYGPDLPTIETFGQQLEVLLKEVPGVKKEAVFADRIVGKPYIHLNIDRKAIARYGLSIEAVQQTIETAIGGMPITSTVEGRERYPVRVRYPRELRDDPSDLERILIPTPTGAQVPLGDLVDIEYVRGPQMIRSEETFLVGYVLFDKLADRAEVEVVEAAQDHIQQAIDSGRLTVPAGVNYKFSGSYENQVRAEKRLALIVPIVLVTIFLILYFQFKRVSTSLMVFVGIAMAFSGAFMLLWAYGQSSFLDFSFLGTNMRELFQMKTINLSVAVWVGFIALFGIATDDGVLIATYLDQSFERNDTTDVNGIRDAVVEAGKKRIRPAIMTTVTTLIALLPVLTSTGRGADIMIPMAIPAFGGMVVACITFFIVPVLYSMREERALKKNP